MTPEWEELDETNPALCHTLMRAYLSGSRRKRTGRASSPSDNMRANDNNDDAEEEEAFD